MQQELLISESGCKKLGWNEAMLPGLSSQDESGFSVFKDPILHSTCISTQVSSPQDVGWEERVRKIAVILFL
jgi:hypothetical protein